ncbi:MAG: PD-(D/E)XK nuclease family protein [Gemmatimonadota bacterium]
MPLRLIRRTSNGPLWSECAESFLRELDGHTGPSGYASSLWLTHVAQRDALYEMAAECGLQGWFAPPMSFLSELPRLFRIQTRPIGILTGRLLVARLAARNVAILHGADPDRDRGPARSHTLDHVFSELLPEGVSVAALREALSELAGDDFARRRSAWVADTYEAFLTELEKRGRFDPRSIHSMVADRIEAGALSQALGGARKLHIYGLTSLRGRQRLFDALAAQSEVEVCVYLPESEEAGSEWDRFSPAGSGARTGGAAGTDPGGAAGATNVRVQPVPDAIREAAWVAREVKQLLADGSAEPHQIAVVARSGREDTQRLYKALESAGVPSTARIRTVLAEIPALRAILWLFRAQSRNWDYQGLRQILASPYFGLDIDLQPIDQIASKRRVTGLEAWTEALRRAAPARFDQSRFDVFCDDVADLGDERPESEWIDLTLDLLRGRMFDFRVTLCRPAGDRWDIVRLDQRGTVQLEALLVEWQSLIESGQKFPASEWYWRLRQLLEANELSLSTPLRQGVQILEAHQAALTAFRHTFVVHANDGIFPRRAARTGVFSDEERAELCKLGLPLSTRSEALSRERALWRSVARGESVTITYRTTDASGVPKLPSLMVPDHKAEDELPRTTSEMGPSVSEADHRGAEAVRLLRHRRSGRASGEMATADPESLRHAVLTAFADELRSGALDDFVRSESGLCAEVDAQSDQTEAIGSEPLESAAAAVFGLDRPLSERPTAWNGKIRDPVVLGELSRRFDESRPWSASQLQTYATRPFDYFLDRVLRLDEIEEADEETSALIMGSVNHRILERFYSELLGDLPAEFDNRAAEVFERVSEEVFGAFEADSDEWLGVPALWEASRAESRQRVEAYLRWELEWLARKNEQPVDVELGFGFDEEEGPLLISGLDRHEQPASLRLRGRIDRIDRHGSAGWLRVVDYKSGKAPTTAGYDDGALLQSALYIRALEDLGRSPVANGVFRSIKGAGKPANSGLLKANDVDRVLSFALSIPARVRSGLFEAVQARTAKKISPWQPGTEITRSDAVISSGSRFDQAAE